MKFDCIVSNAPYDNGLHKKFESKYFDICDGQIVWVSPLSFLLGKKQNKRITFELDKYKTDIEQINGNEYFDAVINGTMGIVFCDMNNINNGTDIKFDGKNYSKCDEISLTSNDELLNEFKRIITPLYTRDNFNNHLKLANKILPSDGRNKYLELHPILTNYCVKIPAIGNKSVVLYSKNYKISEIDTYDKIYNADLKLYFSLQSRQHAINFYNYITGFFVRTCLMLLKTNLNLGKGEMAYIPWFDFSDSMFNGTPEEIDIALFKKYHISQNIVNHIIEILHNYYKLDLSKYIL